MIRKFVAALAALVASTAVLAQDYPNRTITIVVPFAAGGPTDTVARLVGQSMAKSLGQTVIVENVAGAGGTIGPKRVAGGQARRLPARPHAHRHLHQRVALPQPGLQPGHRPRAHRPHHRRADDLHRAQGLPAEGHEGPHRLREGQQGQGHLRERRRGRRLAPVRHALHDRHPDGPHDGSVQGHRARDDRPHGRPGRLHVRPDDQHHAADQGRQGEGLRRDDVRRA